MGTTTKLATCEICGKVMNSQGLGGHIASKHNTLYESTPKRQRLNTSQLGGQLVFANKCRIPTPDLVSIAMTAARREWDWPKDMAVMDFIDTILWEFFRGKGIILAPHYKKADGKMVMLKREDCG